MELSQHLLKYHKYKYDIQKCLGGDLQKQC